MVVEGAPARSYPPLVSPFPSVRPRFELNALTDLKRPHDDRLAVLTVAQPFLTAQRSPEGQRRAEVRSSLGNQHIDLDWKGTSTPTPTRTYRPERRRKPSSFNGALALANRYRGHMKNALFRNAYVAAALTGSVPVTIVGLGVATVTTPPLIASAVPLEMSRVLLTDGVRNVELVGMVHIAPPEFYRDIAELVSRRRSEKWLVFYEEVSDDQLHAKINASD